MEGRWEKEEERTDLGGWGRGGLGWVDDVSRRTDFHWGLGWVGGRRRKRRRRRWRRKRRLGHEGVRVPTAGGDNACGVGRRVGGWVGWVGELAGTFHVLSTLPSHLGAHPVLAVDMATILHGVVVPVERWVGGWVSSLSMEGWVGGWVGGMEGREEE